MCLCVKKNVDYLAPSVKKRKLYVLCPYMLSKKQTLSAYVALPCTASLHKNK
jgi:hypothetical protein